MKEVHNKTKCTILENY